MCYNNKGKITPIVGTNKTSKYRSIRTSKAQKKCKCNNCKK